MQSVHTLSGGDAVSDLGHRPAFELVVLAASAGGLLAIREILAGLPGDFPAALVVVQHRSTRHPRMLVPLLARRCPLRVHDVAEGEPLHPATVYVAPPDLHAVMSPDGTLALTDGRKIRFVLSSANPLFESAAAVLGTRVIAVVLTGGGSDATDGVQAVKAAGGVVIAQDESTSQHFSMPRSAILTGVVDYVLPLDRIAPALVSLVTTGTYEAAPKREGMIQTASSPRNPVGAP